MTAVLLRPRSPIVSVGVAECAGGLTAVLLGSRLVGWRRAVAVAAGVTIATVGPASFWYWTRIREVCFDGRGVELRGFGTAVWLSWAEIEFVRSERLGPTTFLVARASSGRRLPLLSPFRRRFAARLGVPEASSLLVLRTTDFASGPAVFGAALHSYAPPSVRVDWQLSA
ncbi:MAG: hypothetical protein GEV07_24950 [Streptosporangiales bacterium]|nr:hypothetical protein [Streptosporangiales bacterium]